MAGEGEMQERMAAERYAWEWFALHSGQRLQLVNFWLVAVSFLAAAYVQAVIANLRFIAVGLGLLGVIASLAFYRLDARTRQLIQVGEKALAHFERIRCANGQDAITSLVAEGHRSGRRRIDSYRVIVQSLQLVVASLFFLSSLYAVLE
jgi:hypothetical protein